MIYTINGITAHAEAFYEEDVIAGYSVIVNGEYVGNRIDRVVIPGDPVTFESIARNELPIATRDTLREAVADVVNEGLRDRTRR